MKEYRLCYVDLPWIYFTTQDIDKQWGDDWDDAPYEHNAGEPYAPARPDLEDRATRFPKDWNEDGTPKWEIIKVAIDDNYFIEPKYHFSNSPYSVEMINSLMTPWLITNMFSVDKTAVFAGTMLSEFIEIMEKFDTKVYTYEKEKD